MSREAKIVLRGSQAPGLKIDQTEAILPDHDVAGLEIPVEEEPYFFPIHPTGDLLQFGVHPFINRST